MQELIVVRGPARTEYDIDRQGNRITHRSFAERVNDELAALAEAGAVYAIHLHPPAGEGWHTAYILAGEAPVPLTVEPAPRERLYRLDEAAQLLNLSRTTVGLRARTGDIRSVRLGRSVRIPGEEIDRLRAGAQ